MDTRKKRQSREKIFSFWLAWSDCCSLHFRYNNHIQNQKPMKVNFANTLKVDQTWSWTRDQAKMCLHNMKRLFNPPHFKLSLVLNWIRYNRLSSRKNRLIWSISVTKAELYQMFFVPKTVLIRFLTMNQYQTNIISLKLVL